MTQQDSLYIKVLKKNYKKEIKKILQQYKDDFEKRSIKFPNREALISSSKKLKSKKERNGVCEERWI